MAKKTPNEPGKLGARGTIAPGEDAATNGKLGLLLAHVQFKRVAGRRVNWHGDAGNGEQVSKSKKHFVSYLFVYVRIMQQYELDVYPIYKLLHV